MDSKARRQVLLAAGVTAALAFSAPVRAERRVCEDCRTQCRNQISSRSCSNDVCEQALRDTYSTCWLHCVGKDRRRCGNPVDSMGVLAKPKEKLLDVKHHAQTTQSWCWAASIAMIAEYLSHTPVSDCDVVSRLYRANGGRGDCCHHSTQQIEGACKVGGRIGDMTSVMNGYLQMAPVEVHRALTWDEVKESIDEGFPVLVALAWSGGSGHAEVIAGYREPSFLYVLDPWVNEMSKPDLVPYERMLMGFTSAWFASWYFRETMRQEEHHSFETGSPPRTVPVSTFDAASRGGRKSLRDVEAGIALTAQAPVRTAAAPPSVAVDVAVQFPLIHDPPTLDFAARQVDGHTPEVKACYAAGFTSPPAKKLTLRLTYELPAAGAAWVMVKDSGGLPSAVTSCVSDAVSKWKRLFPPGAPIDDSQVAEISFSPPARP